MYAIYQRILLRRNDLAILQDTIKAELTELEVFLKIYNEYEIYDGDGYSRVYTRHADIAKQLNDITMKLNELGIFIKVYDEYDVEDDEVEDLSAYEHDISGSYTVPNEESTSCEDLETPDEVSEADIPDDKFGEIIKEMREDVIKEIKGDAPKEQTFKRKRRHVTKTKIRINKIPDTPNGRLAKTIISYLLDKRENSYTSMRPILDCVLEEPEFQVLFDNDRGKANKKVYRLMNNLSYGHMFDKTRKGLYRVKGQRAKKYEKSSAENLDYDIAT